MIGREWAEMRRLPGRVQFCDVGFRRCDGWGCCEKTFGIGGGFWYGLK